MKCISYLTFIILISSIVSCKGSDDPQVNNVEPKPVCDLSHSRVKLITSSDTNSPYARFTYDGYSRLASVETLELPTRIYNYIGPRDVVEEIHPPGSAPGLVVGTHFEFDSSGNLINKEHGRIRYTYDGEHHLVLTQDSDATGNRKTAFVWKNGNLISSKGVMGDYTFSYQATPNRGLLFYPPVYTFPWNSYTDPVLSWLKILPMSKVAQPVNLISEVTNDYTGKKYAFDYDFDAYGKVIKIIIGTDTTPIQFDITYECE